MSIEQILDILDDFVTGEAYDLDLAGGRIFILEDNFETAVAQFLANKADANCEDAARDLQEIHRINLELKVDSIDDPEPLEDELLRNCEAFLNKYRSLDGRKDP